MFTFVKQIFISTMIFFGNLTNVNLLRCISIKNQECKVKLKSININSNNPIFYPFSIKIYRCNGNCNNINDPYSKICIPNIVKNLDLTVFNLMSRTNETKSIEWHESCKCICRLNAIVCNNKQRWNKNKCRCECKELVDKGTCNKGFIWNPSNHEYECNKSCDVGEYLDYSDCKCKKN